MKVSIVGISCVLDVHILSGFVHNYFFIHSSRTFVLFVFSISPPNNECTCPFSCGYTLEFESPFLQIQLNKNL